jgi:hypothetical protein
MATLRPSIKNLTRSPGVPGVWILSAYPPDPVGGLDGPYIGHYRGDGAFDQWDDAGHKATDRGDYAPRYNPQDKDSVRIPRIIATRIVKYWKDKATP